MCYFLKGPSPVDIDILLNSTPCKCLMQIYHNTTKENALLYFFMISLLSLFSLYFYSQVPFIVYFIICSFESKSLTTLYLLYLFFPPFTPSLVTMRRQLPLSCPIRPLACQHNLPSSFECGSLSTGP